VTQQVINVGTFPGDATGDPNRTAFQKVNANFTEVYGLAATVVVDKFTATAGQTNFILSTDPHAVNNVLVVLDGATLFPTDDYTLAGTTLTLTSGALASQRLMVRYGVFV
jgi:hypothetical protein